jgi:hypothetical protein
MSQSKQLALSIADALEALPRHGNMNLLNAWARELQVGAESPDLFIALSVLFGRCRDLRNRVNVSSQSDRAKELYGGAIDHLANYINPKSAAGLSTDNLRKSSSQINLLHLLADAFPAEMVPDVHPATLEELTKELEGLLSALEQADIEPELRSFIQTSLETLLMVMRSYRAFGPDGAARIYGSVAAELARKVRQEPPSTPEGKSAFKRLVDLTTKIGKVVIWTSAVVGGGDKLLTDATHIADMLSGPAHEVHADKDAKP